VQRRCVLRAEREMKKAAQVDGMKKAPVRTLDSEIN
jgi:hypothetical protein